MGNCWLRGGKGALLNKQSTHLSPCQVKLDCSSEEATFKHNFLFMWQYNLVVKFLSGEKCAIF